VELDVENRTHHYRAYDVHGDHSEPSLERVAPSHSQHASGYNTLGQAKMRRSTPRAQLVRSEALPAGFDPPRVGQPPVLTSSRLAHLDSATVPHAPPCPSSVNG
jgi:hypothetical protein